MINTSKLSIGTRLAAAFVLLCLLMAGMALTAKLGLTEVETQFRTAIDDRYAKVKLVAELDGKVRDQARMTRNLLIMDEADRQQEMRAIQTSREQLGERYKALESVIRSAKGKELLGLATTARAAYIAEVDALIKAVQGGDMAGAKSILLDRVRPQQMAYLERLQALTAFQEELMDEASRATTATVARVTAMTLGAAGIGLALAVIAGVLVTRSVTRPVAGIVATLKTVAGGDLTVEVDVNRADEIGELQRALAETVLSLRKVVSEVRSGVDSVTTASSQIAAGNQDLSSRTEQQASSLQETASSMEQLTAAVRQSADTARSASNLAANASVAAGHGGETMSQVMGTMGDISASSRKVSDIIGVIDGIAFQTNILALNAAVEAARAGEQGRGFAVVAGEVRALAQRSAEAAKEIKSLIDTSLGKVETGSRQVGEAGQAMQDLVEQVRKVHQLIGEIAGTAGEQSRGIEQVNAAVTQMDQVTQQNAALVEESAAAASSLAQQAEGLARVVAAFQVQAEQTALRRPAAPKVAIAGTPAWESC